LEIPKIFINKQTVWNLILSALKREGRLCLLVMALNDWNWIHVLLRRAVLVQVVVSVLLAIHYMVLDLLTILMYSVSWLILILKWVHVPVHVLLLVRRLLVMLLQLLTVNVGLLTLKRLVITYKCLIKLVVLLLLVNWIYLVHLILINCFFLLLVDRLLSL